jgi:hypothetical protein
VVHWAVRLGIVTPKPATPRSTFDSNVVAVVKTLATWRGVTFDEVADTVAMSRSTFYRRLGGDSPWLAAELDRLADAFGVAPAVFYRPVGDLIETVAEPAALDRRARRRLPTPSSAWFTGDELRRGSRPLTVVA